MEHSGARSGERREGDVTEGRSEVAQQAQKRQSTATQMDMDDNRASTSFVVQLVENIHPIAVALWCAPRSVVWLLSVSRQLRALDGIPLDLCTMPTFEGIAGQAQQLASDLRFTLSGVQVELQPDTLPHDLEVVRQHSCWLKLRLRDKNILKLPSFSGCTAPQLDLEGCMKLYDVSGLQGYVNLQDLGIRNCRALKELTAGIGQCKALQVLDCGHCYKLQSLPAGFEKLRLAELTLGQTPLDGAEETYTILSQIPTLTKLDLSYSEITSVPEAISSLQCLETLILERCENLESLPPAISSLQSLQTLILQSCHNLKELPPAISSLQCLKTLDLRFCEKLKSLPPNICSLVNLKELDVSYTGLTELPPDIGMCIQLKEINLYGCQNLESLPPSINGLQSLQTLNLTFCDKLKELPPGMQQLTALRALYLYNCPAGETMSQELQDSLEAQGCEISK